MPEPTEDQLDEYARRLYRLRQDCPAELTDTDLTALAHAHRDGCVRMAATELLTARVLIADRRTGRCITTVEELYALAGESVVIADPTDDLSDSGGAWMGYLGAWFRGRDQLDPEELLARYGRVLLIWEGPVRRG